MNGENKIAEALETVLEQGRPGIPWAAIVVGVSIIYLLVRVIPWIAAGCPQVVG